MTFQPNDPFGERVGYSFSGILFFCYVVHAFPSLIAQEKKAMRGGGGEGIKESCSIP